MLGQVVLRSLAELRAWRAQIPLGESLGFVATMGALHEGHISLVRESVAKCRRTVVSIFVNPTQFAPGEDLDKYPRTLESDLAKLAPLGIDAVYAPSVDDLYPPEASTIVVETSLSKHLCGPFRPGHFRGVMTVVLTLFNQVRPDAAFFGQKDYQQCAVLRRMVRDLAVPVEMVVCPTVREPDGLAMSSRNAYLTPDARLLAPCIYESLVKVLALYQLGESSGSRLAAEGLAHLQSATQFEVEYYSVVHLNTLEPLECVGKAGAVVAVAARLEGTRLIDNVLLEAH